MRLLITLISIFFFCSINSQTAYLKTGFNTTTYDYKNSLGNLNDNVKSSNGVFFEINEFISS